MRFLARFVLLPALALLSGCGLVEPNASTIVFRYREVAPLPRERLALTFHDGRRRWYMEGIDLQPAGDGWLESRAFRAAAGGDLSLTVAIRGITSHTSAIGEVRIPLGPEHRVRIDILPAASYAAACKGCSGAAGIPLPPPDRPEAQDWLFVTWTTIATLPSPAD